MFLVALATAVAGAGGASGAMTDAGPATAAATVTTTFAAVADTYSSSETPTTPHGSLTLTKVQDDGATVRVTYLRFVVSGLAGTVARATLQTTALTSSTVGYAVHSVADNTWSEATLTTVNEPAFSPTVISTSGPFGVSATVSTDVTPVISGDGTYSFALTETGPKIELATKERSAATAPRLVVETDPQPTPPSNTAPPVVSGTSEEGQTLSAAPGTWTGTEPIAYGYRWLACDGGGGACEPLAGETAPTHVLTAGDVGHTLRAEVTASNAAGSTSATSAATAVVAPMTPPANTTAPSVSGTPEETQTLTGDRGAWSGTQPISYTSQWYRCDETCQPISGANGGTYTLTSDDVAKAIRFEVTATNAVGSATAISAPTAPVEPLKPPQNTAVPTITGTAEETQTLTGARGSWSGADPISYTQQWYRCDGASCVAIPGAGALTYTLASADVGKTIRLEVTATNAGGTTTAPSAPTALVAAARAPANTSPPTVSGLAKVGQVLTAAPGSWDGTAPITFAYAWSRCVGGICTRTGATGSTYAVGSGDVGYSLRVEVTATNAAGSTLAVSAPTAVVPNASDPVIAAAGDIACDPTDGSFNGGLGTSSSCHQKATSDLLVGANLASVLTLGDNQYECGGYNAFLRSYDLSWGRVKSITRPTAGNREYQPSGGLDCDKTANGAGYFSYYGAAAGERGKGYYSFDVGTWHLISLNSNCSKAGGCSAGSTQEKWLKADLAAHPNTCTLAFWHHPRFSSSTVSGTSSVAAFWDDLYAAGADVVLNGHAHDYERFAPQAPSSTADAARGIREFIVGTGGSSFHSFSGSTKNSQVRTSGTYGVLKLTLHPSSYDWQFVPEAGKTFTDSGTTACH